jgi:hypothetical protein
MSCYRFPVAPSTVRIVTRVPGLGFFLFCAWCIRTAVTTSACVSWRYAITTYSTLRVASRIRCGMLGSSMPVSCVGRGGSHPPAYTGDRRPYAEQDGHGVAGSGGDVEAAQGGERQSLHGCDCAHVLAVRA